MEDNGIVVEESTQVTPKRDSALGVMKSLLGWILLWFAVEALFGLIVGLIYGMTFKQRPPSQVLFLTSVPAFPVAFIIATYCRTKFDKARLGLDPIKRWWLLALLSVMVLIQFPTIGLITKILHLRLQSDRIA